MSKKLKRWGTSSYLQLLVYSICRQNETTFIWSAMFSLSMLWLNRTRTEDMFLSLRLLDYRIVILILEKTSKLYGIWWFLKASFSGFVDVCVLDWGSVLLSFQWYSIHQTRLIVFLFRCGLFFCSAPCIFSSWLKSKVSFWTLLTLLRVVVADAIRLSKEDLCVLFMLLMVLGLEMLVVFVVGNSATYVVLVLSQLIW